MIHRFGGKKRKEALFFITEEIIRAGSWAVGAIYAELD
jgi:hypothetical protein